jgi:RIO kinase 1
MKIPQRIEPLVEEGLVDEVMRQLMSGKEATVYVVRCGAELRCAKVYKDAQQRDFRQSIAYQEGRKVKNSRDARARSRGTRYGRRIQEEAWQSAEVDALFRLAAAGVRVPRPHVCFEGVLLMELVTDAAGNPAPRLSDVEMSDAMGLDVHATLLDEVVLMLCAGVIHGDLSEYNILLGADGPVIIDLPQAVGAAGNSAAAAILERDVGNLAAYFGRFAPQLLASEYGKEIWALYQAGRLVPGVRLSGHFAADERPADPGAVLREIALARKEEREAAALRLAEQAL